MHLKDFLSDEHGNLLFECSKYTYNGYTTLVAFNRVRGQDGHWCGCPLNGEEGHESHTRDGFQPRIRYRANMSKYPTVYKFELSCGREDGEDRRTVKTLYRHVDDNDVVTYWSCFEMSNVCTIFYL